MIKYQEGDLFPVVAAEPSAVVIPHVCNNQGGWGSGFLSLKNAIICGTNMNIITIKMVTSSFQIMKVW